MPSFLKYIPRSGNIGTVSNNNAVLSYPEQPSQVPVFLIPGIFRNALEMLNLAWRLDNIYKGTRPIYIYHDDYKTNQGHNVVDALQNIIPFGPLPYVLIGYSDGCKEAMRAAKILTAKKQEVRVCLLDGTSEPLTKSYFNSKSVDAINDLVKIINYAAQLSGLPNTFTIDEKGKTLDDDIETLLCVQAQSRIPHLEALLLKKNLDANEAQIKRFKNYIKSACTTIQSLSSQSTEPQIDHVTLFLTRETQDKYTSDTGGWGEDVVPLSDPILEQVTHTELVKPANSERLATLVHNEFLEIAITPDQFFPGQIQFHRERIQALEREYSASTKSSNPSHECSGRDEDDETPDLLDTPPPFSTVSCRSDSEIYEPIKADAQDEQGNTLKSPLGGGSRLFAGTRAASTNLDQTTPILDQRSRQFALGSSKET